MNEDLPQRPETIRPHAVLDCAFPADEDTFTGRMMLRLAGGGWEDTEELEEEFAELAEEFEEFFPDDEPVDPDDVPELLERVTAEYRRVVPEVSYDALVFGGLPDLMLSRGILMGWGDGFDTSEAVEELADRAVVARREGYDVRGYVYAHTQDLDRMILTGRLYLGFGVFGAQDDAAATEIGTEMAAMLGAADVPVEWDGRSDSRLVCDPVLYEFLLLAEGETPAED